MARRSDTLETVRLAIELLRRIPRRRKVTASELHAQLADAGITRDLRTVQRQLEMLSEHYDIERDNSTRPYGYRWKEGASGLALTTMTEQESLLLALAEQHLRSLLPPRLLKSMDAFFAQAHRNLMPSPKAQREREWLRKVRVVSTTQPLLPAPIKPGVLEEVSNALYGNCWLEVDYRNAEGKRSKRDVMPLGLAQQGTNLYLVCRYRGFVRERTLALHRIQSATASTLRFERPADFDLQRFDDDGQFGLGNGKRIVLRFDIDKRVGHHLLETRLSTDQVVQDLGERYRITATVVESEWLWRWVRGFGTMLENVISSAKS